MSETDEARFRRWLADGTTVIAVFEGKAFNSGSLGRKFAMAYDAKQHPAIGDRAPDTSMGPGWKFSCIEVCPTAEAALVHFPDTTDTTG